jgi:tetratricopeptide (TPR) repeat protein
MEQMAMPGSILITADVLGLTEGYIQVKPLGPVPVRGLVAPVEVYEVVGIGAVRTRLQAAVARGLTRFVGRETELDILHQALAQASAGRGQVVALVGEAGVGKSRLVYEGVRSHRTHGWRILESRSVSYGQATGYLPVIELLKAYCQIDDRDDPRSVRAKVTGQVLTLDEALQETLPALLALLEAHPADSPFRRLDPPQRRQRTLEALKHVLLRESQEQPLLVVFEDLHWIDTETQALLDSLVESLPTARMLLLVNYRPEYQHGWGGKTYYTQVRLDPLPPQSADAFLQVLLGSDPSLVPLTPLLIARTQGNPLFLEESVRTLVETGVLAGERGAYHLAQALPTVQVPATVQAVLAARIDRLPPEEKRLLQTAAVIGTEVPWPLLRTIADAPEEALHRDLAHLQAAEFLYEVRLFPDLLYTFKHALTHEVAYGTILQERRRTLHASIVETSETLYRDRLTDQVERLAHHAVGGEMWDKALAYGRQAGEKALARSAYREAVAYFEQALGALPHLPEQRDTLEQAFDLRLALRSALRPGGDLRRTLVCLREAEALAVTLDDPRRLGQILVFLIIHFRLIGAHDQAMAAGQRALALATAGGDVAVHAMANQYLGQTAHDRGDYRRAIDCFGQTVVALDGVGHREHFGAVFLPAASARAWLAVSHAARGMFSEGSALGEEGLRIAETVEHPASCMVASWGIGLLALRQGDLPRALPLLKRAVAICQDADLPFYFPWIAAALGAAYTLAERVADAVPLLTQVMAQTLAMGRIDAQALCHLALGEAHLLAGRLEEAQALAERTLTLVHEHQERGNEAYTLHLLGAIAAHRDPLYAETAAHYYRQAHAVADELGMRPLQAHCHQGLGMLYATTGQREQAHAELSKAIEMYRAMEMTFWLPQTEAVLAQVDA